VKIAPAIFAFVLAAAALLTAYSRPSQIVDYAAWDSIACRLAATANTLAKYAELYEKLSVCWQQT
jgi:hypothetical protein